jgi:uncharacterized protein
MESSFFDDGLHFSCMRCSACCGGGPGYVFLSKNDLRRILNRLKIDFPSFFKKYCRLVDIGTGFALSLAEKKNFDCILWEAEGCSVYEDRPIQCSTFPFWRSILESRRTWDEAAKDCPGINRGELYSRGQIEEFLWSRRAESTIVLDASTAKKVESIDENTILGC